MTRIFLNILIVVWICSPSGAFAQGTKLRKELERAYGELREAIRTSNYEKFIARVEPERPIDKVPAKSEWAQVVGFMDRAYPELSEMKFVKTERTGAWAGYYVQAELDDSQYITVAMYRFHRVGDQWKMSGRAHSHSFLRNPQRNDLDQIVKELKVQKDLKVP